ncbi:SDR family NAD(P)-dependent oxidoreductase [Dictyobacter kobayashii]|uniref:DUF6602 domain-containing protein n=1 Tax=Dictyobacter kobayashii TaxID=2014872 RepID=A0A402ARR6_9CHLR|nr:SDR family NAD(P)-dependent oxidoreductase [Dictyobacter kobayashii]GCE21782.1 hypothetical protein KDK_55820 [Dictyobacter kobayashii]
MPLLTLLAKYSGAVMTDIHKHLPKIVKLVRTAISAAPRDPDALAWEASKQSIRDQLSAFLPASYGIGNGPIINAAGQSSFPVDIIIYDKTRATNEALTETSTACSLKSVLVALQFTSALQLAGPDPALETMRSVKRLQPYRQIPIANKSEPVVSTRNERLPRQAFPLGIVFARGHEPGRGEPLDAHETFCQRFSALVTGYTVGERPDYIYVLEREVYYRNPVLDGRGLKGFELGVCWEPDHQNAESCYVCKERSFRRHFYYAHMCPNCGDLNYVKRLQTADLHGSVALVTGGRLHIGQAVALKLLRAGASVIITTRFPHDAARRYAQEADFASWSERLEIYGLDLRQLAAIQRCTAYIQQQYGRLDILINNAAQTVRRPPAFYAHLMDFELQSSTELPAALQPLLKSELSNALPITSQASEVEALEFVSGGSQHSLIPALAPSVLPCYLRSP